MLTASKVKIKNDQNLLCGNVWQQACFCTVYCDVAFAQLSQQIQKKGRIRLFLLPLKLAASRRQKQQHNVGFELCMMLRQPVLCFTAVTLEQCGQQQQW